jgi:DUF4097 and DUF4098 domain-containing protein YvlB
MSFPAPVKAAVVRVSATSGAIEVVGEPGRTEVWSSRGPLEDGRLPATIDCGSSRVRVLVPEGTDLVVGAMSGRVTIDGRVGAVSAMTTSGKISIADAESVDVRTRSGRIEVKRTSGSCRAVATSGRVVIGHCGDADVTSRSGRIVLEEANGRVHAHCSSGRIEISMRGAHDVDAETVSGRITVSFPAGVRARVVESPGGPAVHVGDFDCVVVARSVSGRVDVSNR